MKGKFIVIDGMDGAGKTTLSRKLYLELRHNGYDVEALDNYYDQFCKDTFKIIENNNETPEVETLMFTSIFVHNYLNYVKPLINDGKIVIYDRWLTTTEAYQYEYLDSAIMATDIFIAEPDLYIYLDVDENTVLERFDRSGRIKDKWESGLEWGELKKCMDKVYNRHKAFFIDANKPIRKVLDETYKVIANLINE